MNPNNTDQMATSLPNNLVDNQPHPVNQITPVSKYLAMALFVLLPFVGGYVGYRLAPEKVIDVHTEWNLPVSPYEEFTPEEIQQLREIRVKNKRDELSRALQQEINENNIGQATSTVVLINAMQPCDIKLPTNTYTYGAKYGDLTLTKHTQSCSRDIALDEFKFTGAVTVRGEVSNKYGHEAIRFFAVTDKTYLDLLPSRNNGVSDIDPGVYTNFLIDELTPWFDEISNSPDKFYIVELSFSEMSITESTKIGPVVQVTLIGEPKIISSSDNASE